MLSSFVSHWFRTTSPTCGIYPRFLCFITQKNATLSLNLALNGVNGKVSYHYILWARGRWRMSSHSGSARNRMGPRHSSVIRFKWLFWMHQQIIFLSNLVNPLTDQWGGETEDGGAKITNDHFENWRPHDSLIERRVYRLYGRLTRSCTSQNAPVRRLGKCTNQIYDFGSETEITRLEIMITTSGFAHCCIVVQLPDAYWCDSATGRCISHIGVKVPWGDSCFHRLK